MKPSEVFAERMREVRERRRWSQQDLADRLDELGWPADRSTLARIEGGTRGVALDDAVAISAALDVAFVNAITFLSSTPGNLDLELAPNVTRTSTDARLWMMGHHPLSDDGRRTYFSEIPDREFLAKQQMGVARMLGLVQQLLDAVMLDDKDMVDELIDDINRQLGRERAAAARREREQHHGKR